MIQLNKISLRYIVHHGLILLFFVHGVCFGQDSKDLSYNRDVRPILAKHCWSCHGPDANSREADLRLDQYDSATQQRKGRAAIRPSHPDQSELVARIRSIDPDERMPPPAAGPALTESQIQILNRWILEGGNYEQHWSFVPPKRPQTPQVHRTDWVQGPIDHFILSKLEKEGVSPSPPADRYTLLRRLFIDLTGLPPTPKEIESFLSDSLPDAYERVVDDLMSRPSFGERWGRTWLDLARYSDTNGYEKDRPRSIWPYRDWVISSINQDLPFDRFTIEQLAGDMLPISNNASQVATGLHRNTMLNEEGGIDPLEFRFYAMNDRVATTGLIWMGMTIGCAQCHTHKYDPISHREYYEFMALLNNADEPDLVVSNTAIADQRSAIEEQIKNLERALPEKFPAAESTSNDPSIGRKAFQAKFKEWLADKRQQVSDWKVLRPQDWKTNLPRLELLEDGSLYSTGDITKRDLFEIKFPKEAFSGGSISALRLEVLPDARLPAGGPGRSYYEGRRGDFFLSEVLVWDGEKRIKVRSASHSYGKNGLGSGSAEAKNVLDGDGSTGWSTASREGEPHQLVLLLEEPIRPQTDLRIEMIFERHYAASLGRFRWSSTDSKRDPQAQAMAASTERLLLRPDAELTAGEQALLEREFAMTTPLLAKQRKEIEQLRSSMPSMPTTLVMQERPQDNPRITHRHHRGEYLSPKEEVQGTIPEIFRNESSPSPGTRLELAAWLASQKNPLVGRVIVNRFWESFFGNGLVRSQGDFGMQSSPPTHPLLIDWLAVDWMESGWSVKRLCKTIVMSATYQQSSTASPELLSKDPENQWCGRHSRQRMEAEAIRDSMLVASGLLTSQVGGPSVRPPQLASVTGLAYGGEAWKVSQGADRFRRSLYTYSKRTAPFAAFAAFDAPSGETCAVRRERSNTPLQALTLLNDAMYLEMAESLGSRVCREESSDTRRAFALAMLAWSRPPSSSEEEAIVTFVNLQKERIIKGFKPKLQSEDSSRIQKESGQDQTLIPWIMAARAILNTDEAIVKP